MSDETTIELYLAIRKKAALEIDPRTAEIEWWYAQTVDPYGVRSEIPDECWQVGREYFARSPGSEVWVSFSDLPDETYKALRKRLETQLTYSGKSPFLEVEVWVPFSDLPDETRKVLRDALRLNRRIPANHLSPAPMPDIDA